MKIKSTKKKTRHILIRVTPYAPFGEENDFMKYGFLYFNYTINTELEVKMFHRKWRKGESRIQRFPIQINEAVLLRSMDIENSDNTNNPDYKHIKYDSLNYLKEKPVFDYCDNYYEISATMLLYFDYFQIYVERIPDGYTCPSIIYRTGANYTKLINYKDLMAK